MPDERDEVYKEANFKFATFDPERKLPTLYFQEEELGSGRIRLAHKNGPKIQDIRKYTYHAFFETLKGNRGFYDSLKKDKTTREGFDQLREDHGGQGKPEEGYYHVEANFYGDHKDSLLKIMHKSGGTVISFEPSQDYIDKAIEYVNLWSWLEDQDYIQ